MKKFTSFVLASALLAFTACDKTEDLLDVDLDGEISKTVSIDYPGNDEEVAIENGIIFSLNDNEEFAKYGDKIKAVSVSKISIEIDNVTVGTDSTQLELILAVAAVKEEASSVTIIIPASNIKAADEAGTVFEKELTEEEASKLGGEILEVGSGGIAYTGTLTNAPAKCDLNVTLKAKITASPLDSEE